MVECLQFGTIPLAKVAAPTALWRVGRAKVLEGLQNPKPCLAKSATPTTLWRSGRAKVLKWLQNLQGWLQPGRQAGIQNARWILLSGFVIGSFIPE